MARMSVDKDDPGHALWQQCRAKGVRVFFEGAEVNCAYTADEERRYIVQADLDEDGNVQIDETGERIKRITRYGHVRIEVFE